MGLYWMLFLLQSYTASSAIATPPWHLGKICKQKKIQYQQNTINYTFTKSMQTSSKHAEKNSGYIPNFT